MLTKPQKGFAIGLMLMALCVVLGTAGFAIIEKWPILDAFYMTLISISTVGYGEIHPLSQSGRLFTSVIIVSGIGAAFFTTTMLGRMILEGEIRGVIERGHMERKISRLRGHIIVCGYGKTGRVVVEELHKDGLRFCVIENDENLEPILKEHGYVYVIGDATEDAVLKKAHVDEAHTLLALLQSDADNLYVTMTAKELNPAVKVVAKAWDETAEVRLKRAGADTVVATFKLAGLRVLAAAVRPTVSEFFDLVSDRQQLSLIMEEVQICEGSDLIGSSLGQAGVRKRYGIVIIAIKRQDGRMIFNPEASETLSANDLLVVIGESEGVRRLEGDCELGTKV